MRPNLRKLLTERILVLDGAMGTMIQTHGLSEEDYRGERFANYEHPLQGNNDLLSITKPDLIQNIHRSFRHQSKSLFHYMEALQI